MAAGSGLQTLEHEFDPEMDLRYVQYCYSIRCLFLLFSQNNVLHRVNQKELEFLLQC